MVTSALLTALDLEQLPDGDRHSELLRGVLHQLAPASSVHLAVTGRLISEVGAYLKDTKLGIAGEGGFWFERDPDTILEPDLAIILTQDLSQLPPTGFMPYVPPLVAEVLSPSNRPAHVATKIEIYRRAGVEVIWIIDPARRRARFIDAAGEQLLVEPATLTGGERFLGLAIPLGELFWGLPLPPLATS